MVKQEEFPSGPSQQGQSQSSKPAATTSSELPNITGFERMKHFLLYPSNQFSLMAAETDLFLDLSLFGPLNDSGALQAGGREEPASSRAFRSQDGV